MSVSGLNQQYLPNTLDGLNIVEADQVYIDGQLVNLDDLVTYENATRTLNMGVQNIQTSHNASSGNDVVNKTHLDNVVSNLSIAIQGTFLDKVTVVPQSVLGSVSFTSDVALSSKTASRVLVLDASKNITSSGISTTKLDFLDNVSSDIQTQLNSKLNLSGSNANQNIVLGGYKVQSTVTPTVDDDLTRKGYTDATFLNKTTNASQAVIGQVEFRNTISHDLQTIFQNGIRLNSSVLGNWNISVEYIDLYTQNLVFTNGTSGATLRFTGDYGFISSSGWSPSKAMITDSSGQLVSSAVDSVKLTYLNGVTSDIQTQINTKASITYVDQQDALKLNLTGGTMTGNIIMGANKVQSSAVPSAGDDYTNKTYVDSLVVGGTSTVLRKADVRNGVAPDAQAGATMSWYFGTHTNNGVTPYADMMIFNGWTDGSGGKTNMLSFNKGITAGIRQYHGDYGSTSNFSSYRDCVMTDFNSANVTLDGTLSMGSNKVTSTAPPTTNDDLTRKGYVDTQDGLRLLKSGDTATGTIYNTGGNFHPHTAGDLNRGIILFANNADGASYTVYNGGLASWYGIGFKSTLDNITRFVFDTRTGNSAQVGTMTAGGINNTGATANRVAIYDVNKNLVSSGVTDTTLSYLDINSSLTTLLATKANLSGAAFSGDISAPTMAIGTTSASGYALYVNGGSYQNGSPIINGNIYQYGADFYIQNAPRGAGGRALVHDVSNILTINYGGDFASVKIDSSVSLGANAITSTSNPTTVDQLSRKGYVDGVVANYLPLTGGTLSGALTVNGAVSVSNRFLGLPDASPTGNFWMGLRGTGSEIDRLAISIVGNQTTGVVDRVAISKSLRLSQPTASRVLTLNASGDVTSSSVTDTTLAYLDATSSVQTQLDSKASITYVDTADGLRVLKAGDVMTGDLSNSGSFISSKFYNAGSNLTYTEASHKNQWWRIMITGPAEDKIYAEFIISYSVAGHHGFIHFRVATCYTLTPYITIIGSSFYGTPIVQKLRLALSNSDLYADGYVEMFLGNFDWFTDTIPIRVNPINQSPFNSAYTITGTITAGTTTGHNYYEVSCDSALEIAGSSTRFRIKEGNVGIGTTNPTSTLHLNTVGTQQIRFQTSHTDDHYITSANDLMALSANLALSSIPNVGRGSCQIVLQTPTAGGFIQFLTGDAINTVPSERMRITGAGRVGIGTTSPSGDLHVQLAGAVNDYWGKLIVKTTSFWGDGCSTRSETAGTQYATMFPMMFLTPHIVSDTDGWCYIRMGRAGGVSTGKWWEMAVRADGMFQIGAERSSQLVINTTGNVGIGTTTISDTFQTQGTASFSGNVGIGTLSKTGVQLRLSDAIQNRKIVLYDGGFSDDHQYYGFGIMGNTLRFNVPNYLNDRFSFFGGSSTTTSTEVFRINGTGELGSALWGANANTTPNLKMSSTASHIDNNAGEVWLFTGFNGHMAIGRNGNRDASTTNLVLGVAGTEEAQVISVASNNSGYKPMAFAASSYNFTYGSVAIGTTPSAYRLDVNGATNVTGAIRTYGNGTGGPSAIYSQNDWAGNDAYALMYLRNDSGTGCYWFLNSSGRTGDGGSNTATLRNDIGTLRLQAFSNTGIIIKGNSSYVGVGTDSPNSSLHVFGDCVVANYTPYKVADMTVSKAGSSSSLAIIGTSESQNAILYLGTPFNPTISSGSAYKCAIIANGASSWSTSDLHFCLNGATGSNDFSQSANLTHTKMTIKASGYVGIGTYTPTGLLDVYSTTADYTNNLLVRAPWAGIVFDNTQIASGRKWHLFSGGVGAGIGAGNFGIFDSLANAYRFSINSLGTVNVDQTLIVGGNTYFNGTPNQSRGNGAADYGRCLTVDPVDGNTRISQLEYYHSGDGANYYQGAWINMNRTSQFYKKVTQSGQMCHGYATAYRPSGNGAGMINISIRVYNQSTGQYFYSSSYRFTNITDNHTVIPININWGAIPAGWYDVFVYTDTATVTDGNDFLSLTWLNLPSGIQSG